MKIKLKKLYYKLFPKKGYEIVQVRNGVTGAVVDVFRI